MRGDSYPRPAARSCHAINSAAAIWCSHGRRLGWHVHEKAASANSGADQRGLPAAPGSDNRVARAGLPAPSPPASARPPEMRGGGKLGACRCSAGLAHNFPAPAGCPSSYSARSLVGGLVALDGRAALRARPRRSSLLPSVPRVWIATKPGSTGRRRGGRRKCSPRWGLAMARAAWAQHHHRPRAHPRRQGSRRGRPSGAAYRAGGRRSAPEMSDALMVRW
jgi:hypothetical protein